MADRHGPLRTMIGRFVERVNGGRISDGAVVVSAAAYGVDELVLGVVEGAPSVPADLVSVVVPGGTRLEAGTTTRGEVMLIVPGPAIGDEAFAAAEGVSVENNRVIDLREMLPAASWTAVASDDGDGAPGSSWLTQRATEEKIEISVEKVERAKAMWVPTGTEPWGVVFGLEDVAPPGRHTEDGETFDPERTMLALTHRALVETWPGDGPPAAVEDGVDLEREVPVAAPLGGVTFGVGVLSTPQASVAGESVNPLADLETPDLLDRAVARRTLARAGVSDADVLEWTAGPRPTDPAGGPSTAVLLGQETAVESFVGVAAGESTPWGVGVHVARVDADDHVVVAGVHRRALGSAQPDADTMAALRGGADLVEARRLFVETVAELEVA